MQYRAKANLILSTVFLLFIVIAVFRHFYPNLYILKILFAVLEAALIGGVADWFAITALFRKPLGISYHTALIPRNRMKLIDSVSQMVENNLLSIDIITNKISATNFVEPIIQWVDENNAVDKVGKFLGQMLEDYTKGLDAKAVADMLARFIRSEIEKVDLISETSKFGRWVLDEEQLSKMMNLGLDILLPFAKSKKIRNKILQIMKEKEAEQTKGNFLKSLIADFLTATDSLNLEEASRALHNEIIKRIEDLKIVNNPLRIKVTAMLQDAIERQAKNPDLQGSLVGWKDAIIRDVPLEEILLVLVGTIKEKIASGAYLMDWIIGQTKYYWNSFKQDKQQQIWIEGFIKEGATRVLKTEHHMIGSLVRDSLASLSDKELNAFIESKAGNDLQWIRVNGSIIGGIVGLALFFFLDLFYAPTVIPWIRNLLP